MTGRYAEGTEQIDVRYVAHLARLYLSDEEAELFQGQLDQVLGYVAQLNELDVGEVEPMAHTVPRVNVFREDATRESLDRDTVLENSPHHRQHLVSVPKILE